MIDLKAGFAGDAFWTLPIPHLVSPSTVHNKKCELLVRLMQHVRAVIGGLCL